MLPVSMNWRSANREPLTAQTRSPFGYLIEPFSSKADHTMQVMSYDSCARKYSFQVTLWSNLIFESFICSHSSHRFYDKNFWRFLWTNSLWFVYQFLVLLIYRIWYTVYHIRMVKRRILVRKMRFGLNSCVLFFTIGRLVKSMNFRPTSGEKNSKNKKPEKHHPVFQKTKSNATVNM